MKKQKQIQLRKILAHRKEKREIAKLQSYIWDLAVHNQQLNSRVNNLHKIIKVTQRFFIKENTRIENRIISYNWWDIAISILGSGIGIILGYLTWELLGKL